MVMAMDVLTPLNIDSYQSKSQASIVDHWYHSRVHLKLYNSGCCGMFDGPYHNDGCNAVYILDDSYDVTQIR